MGLKHIEIDGGGKPDKNAARVQKGDEIRWQPPDRDVALTISFQGKRTPVGWMSAVGAPGEYVSGVVRADPTSEGFKYKVKNGTGTRADPEIIVDSGTLNEPKRAKSNGAEASRRPRKPNKARSARSKTATES